MGKSIARDIYLAKIVSQADTPQRYIELLLASPYRQHQRAGQQLLSKVNKELQ